MTTTTEPLVIQLTGGSLAAHICQIYWSTIFLIFVSEALTVAVLALAAVAALKDLKF